MLPTDVKRQIPLLDAAQFTAFVTALLSAEAGRLGMPPGSITVSDALNENDGGLDALIVNVSQADVSPRSALPHGLVGVQFKTVSGKTPGVLRLPKELEKPGPTRVISSGGTYLVVWSQDLNPEQKQEVGEELQAAARARLHELGIDLEPSTLLWDAQTLADLGMIHPAPAVDIGVTRFGRAYTLADLLRQLHADLRPFQSDPARDAAVSRLRERVRSAGSDALLLALHGDPGAGKTRTVAHALDVEGIRESVLYVEGLDGLHELLREFSRNELSRGILIADELDDRDAAGALAVLGGLRGRWRLITISSRGRAGFAEGSRNIVLEPLEPAATKRLVEQHAGLPPALAEMVAEVAAGFPELAFYLADELVADQSLDLMTLSRLPQPHQLLERVFSDAEHRKHLAPIALFKAVGFDDDVRYQLESVAEVFELDPAAIEHYCDGEVELRRFVSRAGRYRVVSPLLFATWLAADLIERIPRIEEKILTLPEPLQDAFIAQLDFLSPNARHLQGALRRILTDERFRRPEDFTEAAGRLLRASAAIVPEQVGEAISQLLQASDDSVVRSMPRRDLVWALEILRWWPSTWPTAVDGLFRFATNESETWSNNATGEFVSSFTLLLSGTTVSYPERAAWLKARIASADDAALNLLASAAAAGLRGMHSRSVVGFRGGGEPTDWEPTSLEEHLTSRALAWEALLQASDRMVAAGQDRPMSLIAEALPVALGSGLADAIDRDLRARDWSSSQRSELATSLRGSLEFDEPLRDVDRATVAELISWLTGSDDESELDTLINTPYWRLFRRDESPMSQPPELLTALADRLAAREDGLELAISRGRDLTNQQSRRALFTLLARKLGTRQVFEAAERNHDFVALEAALWVADEEGDSAWVFAQIQDLAKDEPERAVELLAQLRLAADRLDFALELVEAGLASASPLGGLMYGGRIESLEARDVQRLLEAIGGSGEVQVATAMLAQWLEAHGDLPETMVYLARDLAISAMSEESSASTSHWLERIVSEPGLDPFLPQLWATRMAHRTGLVERLDDLLTRRALERPIEVAPVIYDLVLHRLTTASVGALAARDLSLLSRLAAATSPDEVWAQLQNWSDQDLAAALAHMDWRGAAPDPLVRLFLLSNRLSALGSPAYAAFFNTLGTVVGPYYLALEREQQRAEAWRNALRGTSAEAWIADVIDRYGREVDWHRQRDAESDAHLR